MLCKGLGGGHVKKPPRSMPAINRGDHFLLTEAVKKTVSQNQLTEADNLNVTASVNSPIFEGGSLIKVRLD